MMNFSKKLYSIVSVKILFISIVVFIVFTAAVLPIVSNYTAKIIGSAESPDTSLIYKASDLYKMAENYGTNGRKIYIILRFTFDLFWPLVYLFFLVAAITKLLSIFKETSKLRYLNLFPFLGALFDYLENIGVSIVIGRFPKETIIIAQLTPVFTLTKWLFIGASFLILILLLLYHGYKLIKKKKRIS